MGVLADLPSSSQVNREIVSGMKYIQHTYRKGVKSEWRVGNGKPVVF